MLIAMNTLPWEGGYREPPDREKRISRVNDAATDFSKTADAFAKELEEWCKNNNTTMSIQEKAEIAASIQTIESLADTVRRGAFNFRYTLEERIRRLQPPEKEVEREDYGFDRKPLPVETPHRP